jgi:hypothetical protein
LVVFDILTLPALELSTEERAEVKKVANQLLEGLEELLVLAWRNRQAARARVEDAIKDLLDTVLARAYSSDLLYLLYLRGTLRLYRRCVVKPEVSGKEARVLAKVRGLLGRTDAKTQSIPLLTAQKIARRKAV